MINVQENENGSFTISWDPDDPQESILNTWTEEDFTKVILDFCNQLLEEDSSSKNQ